jgi:hypothetical protein
MFGSARIFIEGQDKVLVSVLVCCLTDLTQALVADKAAMHALAEVALATNWVPIHSSFINHPRITIGHREDGQRKPQGPYKH